MAISKIDSDGITAGGITADSLNIGQIGGRRNLIINGAMQVAQRGTSETGVTSSGYYTVDRWVSLITNVGTWTHSQSSEAPDGFSNSLKVECTTAKASPDATTNMGIQQRIEGQNLQHLKYGASTAQSVTLSFWVRSNKTGTYIAELLSPDASSRHIGTVYTISAADTWEQKTITFVGDTSGGINNDNGDGLQVRWWLVAGSNFSSGTLQTSWGALDQTSRAVGQVNLADTVGNDFYLTGVQLEVGDTATPFEHRSYQDELLACCRYYFKKDIESAGRYFGLGNIDGSTGTQIKIDFPVPMRTAPTSVETTGTGSDYRIRVNSNQDCDAVPLFIETCRWNSSLNFRKSTGHGGTNGQAAFGVAATDGSYLAWSAEL